MAACTFAQKPLRESMANPEFVITDWAKFEHPAQMHIGFQFIDAFQAKNGRLPMPYSEVRDRWHSIMYCVLMRGQAASFLQRPRRPWLATLAY
jgi:hypothetical protein